jgi:hypothetical protein
MDSNPHYHAQDTEERGSKRVKDSGQSVQSVGSGGGISMDSGNSSGSRTTGDFGQLIEADVSFTEPIRVNISAPTNVLTSY